MQWEVDEKFQKCRKLGAGTRFSRATITKWPGWRGCCARNIKNDINNSNNSNNNNTLTACCKSGEGW